MKIKNMLFLVCALWCASAVAEYNCWATINDIGDYMVVAVGETGVTMSKWVSLDLSPTNAPDANVRYSVRCRVCYIDNQIKFPKSENERECVRLTRRLLNLWLLDFVSAQYAGAEYGELINAYYDGEFVRDLNKKFPEYVADQIAEMDSRERLSVSIVAIETESEGVFRENLIREMEKAPQESE